MTRARGSVEAHPLRSVRPDQVARFRWRRHGLDRLAPSTELVRVAGAIAGAQAQLLSAAEIAIAARVDRISPARLDRELWHTRRLARAWAMRRTAFLLPAADLSLFVEGSARRADREILWARRHRVGARALERAIAGVFAALDAPRTIEELAAALARSLGSTVQRRRGGGWGSARSVPWVRVGGRRLPVNYLLHLAGARGAICFGPNRGAESTYVRADAWLPSFRPTTRAIAEPELLRRYLSAYGPSTVRDYARWTGMRLRDAREIWSGIDASLVAVRVGARPAWLLADDLADLVSPAPGAGSVRLLPYFDSYLLGHERRDHLADGPDLRRVYRPAGWVEPTVAVDGRLRGTWKHRVDRDGLRVTVRPFGAWPPSRWTAVGTEVERLAVFLGVDSGRVVRETSDARSG